MNSNEPSSSGSKENREFILVGQDQGGHYELWDISPAPIDPAVRALKLDQIGDDATDTLGDMTTVWAADEAEAIEKFRTEQAEINDRPDYPVIWHGQKV